MLLHHISRTSLVLLPLRVLYLCWILQHWNPLKPKHLKEKTRNTLFVLYLLELIRPSISHLAQTLYQKGQNSRPAENTISGRSFARKRIRSCRPKPSGKSDSGRFAQEYVSSFCQSFIPFYCPAFRLNLSVL